MTDPVARSAAQAFYRAYVSRDPAQIAACLDDDVEWSIVGPVDLLPFCGQHRGKKAVIKLFTHLIPEIFEFRSFEPKEFLVDGDRAATFSRLSGVQRSTGRIISYRCAQFLRFREDKLVCFRAIIDSFDAAEQMIGRSIDLKLDADRATTVPAAEFVAV